MDAVCACIKVYETKCALIYRVNNNAHIWVRLFCADDTSKAGPVTACRYQRTQRASPYGMETEAVKCGRQRQTVCTASEKEIIHTLIYGCRNGIDMPMIHLYKGAIMIPIYGCRNNRPPLSASCRRPAHFYLPLPATPTGLRE